MRGKRNNEEEEEIVGVLEGVWRVKERGGIN